MDADSRPETKSPEKGAGTAKHVTRRDLLKSSGLVLAGLSFAPLSKILAADAGLDGEIIRVMSSELLDDVSPMGLALTNSACTSACDGVCYPPLYGDVDGNCEVDGHDLRIMSEEWLTGNTSALSNLDGYCHSITSASDLVCVDFEDYSIMADEWQFVSTCTSATSALSHLNFLPKTRARSRAIRMSRLS